MTLAEAEAWLASLINVERLPSLAAARLSLEPIRRLMAALGDPQRGLRVLHVAGSKGKGSTALLAEALLREAGLSTGTFTSPHLERWTERFRIDGREIGGEALAAAVERVRREAEPLRAGDAPPTFFDATTAAALLLFADAEVDVAILEVGLGGRLDSTNLVDPAVCCITSIELEHTEKLGTTLAAIAGEKAGIAKPGVPLVVGELPPEAMAAVEARAREVGAPLRRLGREIGFRVVERHRLATRFALQDGALALEAELAWPGAHQAANAALAVACVRQLALVDDAGLRACAERAFAHVVLPGRAEVLARRPWVIADGAHTAVSARALADWLSALPHRDAHLVLSVSAGKELARICEALAPLATRVTVTRADAIRSLTPAIVAEALRAVVPQVDVRVVPNPHLALRAAREALGPEDLLCATGSVYLAGVARGVFGGAAPPPQREAPGPAPRVAARGGVAEPGR